MALVRLESLCHSLFLSLSFSVFFCVQTLATVWPPPGGGGHVGKQRAPASEASRLLLGRGGRAKVVVIKSWPWCVLRHRARNPWVLQLSAVLPTPSQKIILRKGARGRRGGTLSDQRARRPDRGPVKSGFWVFFAIYNGVSF